MVRCVLLILALPCPSVLLAFPDISRTGGIDHYECVDTSGVVATTTHAALDAALSACGNAAEANGRAFEVREIGTAVVYTITPTVPLPPSELAQDSFTDANGTEIGDHVPEAGGPWFAQNWLDGSALAANEIEIQNNQLHIVPTGARGAFIDRGNTNDFTLEFDWHVGAAAYAVSVMMRYVVPHTGIKSATYFVIRQSSNDVILRHVVDGSTSNVASAPLALTNNAVHHVEATMVGNEFTLVIDGVSALQATSTAHAAETHSGLMVPLTADETQVFDNFVITDDGSSPAPPPTSAFTPMMPAYESVLDGWACYGCNWETFFNSNPAVEIRRVTNTNVSGAGSFNHAITAACAANTFTVVVFETSGMVNYPADSKTNTGCDFLYVAGGSAPSPGFYFRNTTVAQRFASHQVWTHLGGFNDGATTQPTGKCWSLEQTANHIVLLNVGCVFNTDGAVDVWDNIAQHSILQSQLIYPIGEGGTGNHISLWGHPAGTSETGMMARNVMANGAGRIPKANGVQESTLVNNVMYNADNNFTHIQNGDGGGVGFDLNIVGNIYMAGPDTEAGMRPVWTGTFSGFEQNAPHPGTRLYMEDNRVFGLNMDDNNQATLLDNDSGITVVGTRLENAWPDGFVDTPIGAGNSGEETMALLICEHSGPRPSDTNRPNHWDRTCQEIQNEFDGAGPVGSEIGLVSQHPDGIPVVAVNTCDLDVANDCGAGIPALPAAPNVDNMRTWLNDVYCARMPAGATGC